MATPLRRFVLPPRPLEDYGGPPPVDLGGGIPYAGGVDYPQEGPPPLDPQSASELLAGGNPVPLDQRQQMAVDSPSADWMYEPYRPTEGDLQARQPMQGGPGKPQPGGLRRALGIILPIARELAASTAAGSTAPTAIQGLGAGLATSEQRQHQQQSRELQAIHNWQKLQIEAAKTQAEIEKMGSEKTRNEAAARYDTERALAEGPRQRSQAELQAAQAQQATQHGEYYKMFAREKQAGLKAGLAEKEADLKAAQATNYKFQNQRLQENLANRMSYREAALKATQETREAAEARRADALAEKYAAETEAISDPKSPQNVTRAMFANAAVQNAIERGRRTVQLMQQGQMKPADIWRAIGQYSDDRAKMVAAPLAGFTAQQQAASRAERQQAIAALDALYAPILKQKDALGGAPAPAPTPGGGPPPLGGTGRPRATNPQTGETVELVDGQWVPVAP